MLCAPRMNIRDGTWPAPKTSADIPVVIQKTVSCWLPLKRALEISQTQKGVKKRRNITFSSNLPRFNL